MKGYYIERPEVSAGLKRTYHKKLEVYYGEFTHPVANRHADYIYYRSFQAAECYTYNKKTCSWVKKPTKKCFHYSCHVKNTDIFDYAELDKQCGYKTLEAACTAKLLLIKHMSVSYKKALDELQALYKRNVPEIQKPLDQLLETHPDLFI